MKKWNVSGVLVCAALMLGVCAAAPAAESQKASKAADSATSAPGVADRKTYLNGLKAELLKEWPHNRTINVVCHGHSVPTGYFNSTAVHTLEAYPHLLLVAVKERYPYAVVNVITTSIGGEEAGSGAVRFERDVLNHRPDVITIDYSLNDRMIGLEKARAGWVAMIEKAKAAGIPVILLTPTPDTTAKLDDPNDPLNQHARQVRELAAQYNVGLVDSLAAFERRIKSGAKLDDLMAASNHPNRKGHEIVAAELVKWFE